MVPYEGEEEDEEEQVKWERRLRAAVTQKRCSEFAFSLRQGWKGSDGRWLSTTPRGDEVAAASTQSIVNKSQCE